MLPGTTTPSEIEQSILPLTERGLDDIQGEGFVMSDIQIEQFLDMRYKGQSYELTIPLLHCGDKNGNYKERFHQQHQMTYGYQRQCAELEIVNVRVRATGFVPPPEIPRRNFGQPNPSSAFVGFHEVVFSSNILDIPFYRGEDLNPGNIIQGPAGVVRSDTTILIEPGNLGKIDPFDNLIIDITNRH